MPPRPLDPNDVITLPRLDALEAITLAQALDAAARDGTGALITLPENVAEAFQDIGTDRAALQDAVGAAAPPAEVRKVDRREDRAVRAFYKLLAAWAELAGEIPEGKTGESLLGRLFEGNGLSFLTLPPRSEWAAVETKLKTIDDEGLEPQLGQLGAAPMLALLRQVHVLYGQVTGATRAAAPPSPQVRARLDALLDSIRHYVAAVVGSVRRREPATKELADKLLQPLADWESKNRSSGGGGSGGAGSGSGGT